MVPLVQFGVYPPGTVIPVTDSDPVPALPMVIVNSDVLPISTAPKFRLPPSETTRVAAAPAVEFDAGVGAEGLPFPQAEAEAARRTSNRTAPE